MVNGKKSNILGKTMNVPVMFDQSQARIDFIVLQNVPFHIVIGRPTLKRIGGMLNFRVEEVCLNYHGQEAVMSMVSECSLPREIIAGTDSEEFLSDSDAEQSSADESVDEELLLMLSMQEESGLSEQPAKEGQVVVPSDLLHQRMYHLSDDVAGSFISIFTDSDVWRARSRSFVRHQYLSATILSFWMKDQCFTLQDGWLRNTTMWSVKRSRICCVPESLLRGRLLGYLLS